MFESHWNEMKSVVLALAAACAGVVPTSSAFAQAPAATPAFEVSAGYQPLFVTGDPGATFPFGVAVDLAVNAGPSAFIAEGGWSKRSEGEAPDEIKFDFWHAAGGYRWTRRTHPRIWPYVQGLIGVAFHAASGEVAATDQTDTTAHFMVQPGGGVTIVVRDGFGVFGAVDYRRVYLDEETDADSGLNEVRLLVGVRLSFR
jgi:hypothetical protein